MISTRREVQLLHGGLQQFLGGRFDLAKGAHFGWSHLGVAGHSGAFEPLQLDIASRLHPLANSCGGLHLSFLGQFLVVHTGDFDVDVNAVEHRAADALRVARDGGGRAGTFSDGVIQPATKAPVQLAVANGSR